MKKIVTLTILAILSLTLVSAYNGYYGTSPSDWLENEYVIFGIILVVFFAIIFAALSKSFKEQKGVAAVIALAISILIAVAFSKRIYFSGFISEQLFTYLLLGVAALIYALLLKVVYDHFKKIGIVVVLFASWLILHFTDFVYILFEDSLTDSLFTIYELLASWWALIIIAIISILLISFKKKESGWDQLMKKR